MTIVDSQSRPVSGASVKIETLNLAGTSDSDGLSEFKDVALPLIKSADTQATFDPVLVSGSVTASGYGSFAFRNVSVFPDGGDWTPLVELTDKAQVHDLTGLPVPFWAPRGVARPEPTTPDVVAPAFADENGADLLVSAVPSGHNVYSSRWVVCNPPKPTNNSNVDPPAQIAVYRASSGIIEFVDFKTYAKGVLPNEWIPGWQPAALQAGAMAVKTYGWYWVKNEKYPTQCYNVNDGQGDQVYNPLSMMNRSGKSGGSNP